MNSYKLIFQPQLYRKVYVERWIWKNQSSGVNCDLKCSVSFLDLGHPDHLLNLPPTDLMKYFCSRIPDLVDQWNTLHLTVYLCKYTESTFSVEYNSILVEAVTIE